MLHYALRAKRCTAPVKREMLTPLSHLLFKISAHDLNRGYIMNNFNNNGNKLLDKISDLDPKLITDADKKPHKTSKLLIGITSGMATVAAAAVIAVAAGKIPTKVPPVVDTSDPSSSYSNSDYSENSSSEIVDSSSSGSVSDSQSDPPKLDFSKYKDLPKISSKNYAVTGAGTMYYDDMYSWELDHSSPWKGAELETMPVYMSGSTEIPDLDKMYARVKEIAAALGIPENSLTITDNYVDMSGSIEQQRKLGKEAGASDEEIEEVIDRMIRSTMSMVYVEAEADGITIRLDASYAASIHFDEPLKLPDGYNFAADAAAEEKNAVLNYLAERYKELMGYVDPLPGQNTSLSGLYCGFIYEADGELTEQIVNYWINSTEFMIEENALNVIWIYSDDALTKLADYPILTVEQAEAFLKSNKYNADERMPADVKIVKTDMVYRNLPGSTAVMPYYKFYVETDEEPHDSCGLVCKIYTIAAVPEEFIDMETKDYGVRA